MAEPKKTEIFGISKEWYKSKTMWANILIALAGIATAIAGELRAGATLTVIGVLNIVLRVVTNTGIKK